MNRHLFFFCPSLYLCRGHSHQDETDIKREISIQAKFEGYFPPGKNGCISTLGFKVEALTSCSPVCFEEKPASRQSICTTLSCYHSQIPLSVLQRCRIVLPRPSLLLIQSILPLPPSKPQVLEGHSNGSRSPAQAHSPVIIFQAAAHILLRSLHTKVINPIHNYAGRTQLLHWSLCLDSGPRSVT